jgi:CheY-like chemotaxis protein
MSQAKIVTIDDDPFYKNLYNDILGTKGFEVRHALSAAEGFELIKVYSPDLVTLDIMMPEQDKMMDGYGLLEELRCTAGCEHLPIIMISALSEEGDIQRALDLGANDYIPKIKLTPNLLMREINQLLKMR